MHGAAKCQFQIRQLSEDYWIKLTSLDGGLAVAARNLLTPVTADDWGFKGRREEEREGGKE